MADPVLSCSGLSKRYQDGSRAVQVLQGVDLSLQAGERIAIVGRSGSGKSTPLNLLGGWTCPVVARCSSPVPRFPPWMNVPAAGGATGIWDSFFSFITFCPSSLPWRPLPCH